MIKTEKEKEDLIVKSVAKGDKKSYGFLIAKYKDLVYNLIYRMLKNRTEAEDLLQETFIQAYKNLKNYQTKYSFSTWLCTIAVNLCRNKLKSKENQIVDSLDGMTTNTEGEEARQFSDGSSLEKEVTEKMDSEKRVEEILGCLPFNYRVLIYLRYFDNLSIDEISQISELPAGTVKSYLSRAREILQTKVKSILK